MNCFHFSVSLGYKTTPFLKKNLNSKLWIAFIFQYLWDTKQRNFSENAQLEVVNCFHFSVSLGYKTTNRIDETIENALWIAFIFQYLWDTKQQYYMEIIDQSRCELLSFFSIFGIQNNQKYENNSTFTVVNCFHFSVSLGYKTTLIHDVH